MSISKTLEEIIPDPVIRAQAEEEIASRMLGVLEEMSIGVIPVKLFIAWENGKSYAVTPDRVEGIYEALETKFRNSRTWSLLSLERAENYRLHLEIKKLESRIRELEEAAI